MVASFGVAVLIAIASAAGIGVTPGAGPDDDAAHARINMQLPDLEPEYARWDGDEAEVALFLLKRIPTIEPTVELVDGFASCLQDRECSRPGYT